MRQNTRRASDIHGGASGICSRRRRFIPLPLAWALGVLVGLMAVPAAPAEAASPGERFSLSPERDVFADIKKVHGAIPSFSRQTGLDCAACHTQPPRLTRTGQDFKMSGYTMTTAATTADGSILENLPVSARIRGRARVEAGDGIDGTRTRIEVVQDTEGDNPEPVRLYIAGRVMPNMGVYSRILNADVRASITGTAGAALFGVVGGHTRAGGTDPFQTIGGERMMGYIEDRDFVFDAGPGTADPWRRRSVGANAFVYTAGVYLAAGFWDYRNAGALEVGETSDLIHLRAAFRPNLGETNTHIGVHSQRVSDIDLQRLGLDLSSQIPIGDDLLLDLIGVVTTGTDDGDRHTGFQLSSSLHRGRLAYGLQYATYDRIVGDANTVGGHLSFMLQPNARVGLDLVRRSFEGAATRHLVLVYDMAF